jgi:hypothetical protein
MFPETGNKLGTKQHHFYVLIRSTTNTGETTVDKKTRVDTSNKIIGDWLQGDSLQIHLVEDGEEPLEDDAPEVPLTHVRIAIQNRVHGVLEEYGLLNLTPEEAYEAGQHLIKCALELKPEAADK